MKSVIFCFLVILNIAPFSNAAEKGDPVPFPSTSGLIRTTPMLTASVATRADGIATILNPDPLLQLDADIAVTSAAAVQSQGILARDQALHADDETISRQELETAIRQAANDTTQLDLLNHRLILTWGSEAPFIDPAMRKQMLEDLSTGRLSLARVDFSSPVTETLHGIRLLSLHDGETVQARDSWPAPISNPSLPGRSYFILIPGAAHWRPGAIVQASADLDAAQQGWVIPAAAIILDAGQAWCYIKMAQGDYARHAVLLNRPVDGGYLVSEGFTPGTEVVIQGAGLLLSAETAAPEAE